MPNSCAKSNEGFLVASMVRKRFSKHGESVTRSQLTTPSPAESVASSSRIDVRGLPAHDNCHTIHRESILSDLDKVDFFGLVNLSILTLLATNARLVIENFLKYGIRINFAPPSNWNDLKEHFPLLFTLVILHGPFFLAFVLEKYVNTWLVSPKNPHGCTLLSQGITGFNALIVLLAPPFVINGYPEVNPLGGALLLCCSIVWFLKLCSLHHVAIDTRRTLASGGDFDSVLGKEVAMKFPGSLSFGDFYAFMVMPTMCFQFAYPRTPRLRKRMIAKWAFYMALCATVIKLLYEQYTIPILQNTFLPPEKFAQMSRPQIALHFAERMLKLSVPNLYMWLLMFVLVFHLWLNLLAELTTFGDRGFYLDWWNSAGFDEYWRKWNLPIHEFFYRHIYKPLLRRGFSRSFTMYLVFIISAVAHEYVIDVPLRTGTTGLVLVAFLLQAPLVRLTACPVFKERRSLGNALFWVVFCFSGQPLSMMVYYYLWGVRAGIQSPVSFRHIFRI